MIPEFISKTALKISLLLFGCTLFFGCWDPMAPEDPKASYNISGRWECSLTLLNESGEPIPDSTTTAVMELVDVSGSVTGSFVLHDVGVYITGWNTFDKGFRIAGENTEYRYLISGSYDWLVKNVVYASVEVSRVKPVRSPIYPAPPDVPLARYQMIGAKGS